jgi:Na+(H+)/acetate symporter ActP
VFAFYQFKGAPIFFNQSLADRAHKTAYHEQLVKLEKDYQQQFSVIPAYQDSLSQQKKSGDRAGMNQLQQKISGANDNAAAIRKEYKDVIKKAIPGEDTRDTNYIFLRFVVDYLPAGLVGLLIAIIFLASWGSIAAALNSLASSTMIDFHKRFSKKQQSPEKEFTISRWYTFAWGVFSIIVAMFAYNLGNSLIETVNVLGSLFYGVILGVFLVAFIFKKVKNGTAVFIAALMTEAMVLLIFGLTKAGYIKLGFLWLNPIGALGVILFTLIINQLLKKKGSPV